MAYKKGDLKKGEVADSRELYDCGDWFYLPHSCDEWVIGTEEEARRLIADLEELLAESKK